MLSVLLSAMMCFPLCETETYSAPGPDCKNLIINEINNAQNIDVMIYSFTDADIGAALIRAHNRGAKIRIVADRTQAGNSASVISKLRNAGIAVKIDTQHKIQHNKVAIFDSYTVLTGSFNWTQNATHKNSENCVIMRYCNNDMNAQFDVLWKSGR